MSSPGLRAPINSQPYGFQLWVLADVCPTLRSIWHAEGGGFGVIFGELGRFRSHFDYQSSSGGLVFFPRRWNYGTMWLLFVHESDVSCLESLLGVCKLLVFKTCSNWMKTGSCTQVLAWYKLIKPIKYKTVWEVRLLSSFLSYIDGHVLTWFSSTTELWAAGSSVRHPEVLWGLAGVSSHVSTLNTTRYSRFESRPRRSHPRIQLSRRKRAGVDPLVVCPAPTQQRVFEIQVVKYFMFSAACAHWTWQPHNSYGRWFIFLKVIKCLLDHLFIFCLGKMLECGKQIKRALHD